MPDNINTAPYKIGESFRNAEIVKPITHIRRKPFFAMTWADKGPTDRDTSLWKSGSTRQFPAVWNRVAKARVVAKLGKKRTELASFDELGMGEAPGATAPSVTSATERTWWGSLVNTMINTGGTFIQKQQELQLLKAQTEAQQRSYMNFPFMRGQEGGMGLLGWGVLAAGVGAIGYFVLKNSK
jgi:hypothetical protein